MGTYEALILTDGEEKMEVFEADSDSVALGEAFELCSEGEILSELWLVDGNYNKIQSLMQ